MEAFIAIISEPVFPDIGNVEERRLIVLASSREAAEEAFDDYVDKHGLGGWSVEMTDEKPEPGYLQAAPLEPNVVKATIDSHELPGDLCRAIEGPFGPTGLYRARRGSQQTLLPAPKSALDVAQRA